METVSYPFNFEEFDIRPYNEAQIVDNGSPIYYNGCYAEFTHLVAQICFQYPQFKELTFILSPSQYKGEWSYYMKVNGSPAMLKELMQKFPAEWEASMKKSLEASLLSIRKEKGLVA